ncbi:MAG TPA: nucleotidyltransferase family protein [Polyangia bacterium]|nr:nucleotidyltransferase family protein [Polyangia bacterium]
MRRRAARVGCAVLAAGGSSRMGRPKQLLSYRGQPLLRRIADLACQSSASRVAVVVGAASDRTRAALTGLPVDIVENAHWRQGMSSSVRAAVSWARRTDCDGLLLAVGDQPHLGSRHLDALMAASAGATRIAASAYAGVLGVPALFPWELFQRLESLTGDEGARSLLRSAAFRVVPVAWSHGAIDVDTPADLPGMRAAAQE